MRLWTFLAISQKSNILHFVTNILTDEISEDTNQVFIPKFIICFEKSRTNIIYVPYRHLKTYESCTNTCKFNAEESQINLNVHFVEL